MLRLTTVATLCMGCMAIYGVDVTKWNDLKVNSALHLSTINLCASVNDFLSRRPMCLKWSKNIIASSSFEHMPLTAAKAEDSGFEEISGCDENLPWAGRRFIKDNEYALILLYDINGNIAGIQTSIPNNQPNGYPERVLRPPFVPDGDSRWAITAYFVPPSTICTTGRSSEQVKEEGTGSNLYLQNSIRPEDSVLIPREEAGLADTKWVEGNCFYTMGKHYWYDLWEDMKCNSIFPFFLLYNNRLLNGFGFALVTDINSFRYEHPPKLSYSLFMTPAPKCLDTAGKITTMHVFLNSYPAFNFC